MIQLLKISDNFLTTCEKRRIMFIIFQMLLVLYQMIPLFYFTKRTYQFKILLKRRCIREMKITFNKIQDFFPKVLKQKIENDHTIIKRHANEVIQSYQKCFFHFAYTLYHGLFILQLLSQESY